MKRISIIIPTLNDANGIEKCLRKICSQSYPLESVEVVVIDGLSGDGTDKIVKECKTKLIDPQIVILKQPKRGPAAARNLGIMNSTGKLLVFIDADCYPTTSTWLREICRSINGETQVIVHGRVRVPRDNFVQRFIRNLDQLGTPDYGNKSFTVHKRFISFPTTNLVVTKKVFENIGLFDEDLIVGEDIDFCRRAYLNGVTMKYEPSMTIDHTHRTSITQLLNHSFKYAKHSYGLIKKYGIRNSSALKNILSTTMCMIVLSTFLYFAFYSPQSLLSFMAIVYFVILVRFVRNSRKPEILLYPFLYSCHIIASATGAIYGLIRTLVSNLKTINNAKHKGLR